MRYLILVCLIVSFFSSSKAQSKYESSDTTNFYSFHINYWFNMHHFLWLETFMNTTVDSTLVPEDLPANMQSDFFEAVAYYRENLVNKDLRMDDYMTEFKEWITGDEFSIENVPDKFNTHFEVLNKFNGTYNNYFWPGHEQKCLEVLNGNIETIKTIEKKYVDQITAITKQFWPEGKVRVDIVIFAKSSKWNLRNRPYTSIFPTHVVMNAIGENDVPGNWVELLLHESAHPLILGNSYFVGGTINDVAEVHELKKPRQLWHAYLFYFTGKTAQNLLEEIGIEYPATYMERNGVFSRYLPVMDKYLGPYMEKKMTLAEASIMIMMELNN